MSTDVAFPLTELIPQQIAGTVVSKASNYVELIVFTPQAHEPTKPSEGTVIYASTGHQLEFWNGSIWVAIAATSVGVSSVTGTAGEIVTAPTTGAVVVSLAATITTAHTWSALQTFSNGITVSGGNVTVTNKIHVGLNSTQALEANIYGISVTKDVQAGGFASAFAFTSEFVCIDSTNDTSGAQHISGAQIAAIATSPANYHELWGVHPYSVVSVGGTVDLAIGTYTQTSQTSGTLLCGVGAETDVLRSGGTMTTAISLAVSYHSTHVPQGLNAVATNQYGIRVGPIINGTLNYAIYTEEGIIRAGDKIVSAATRALLIGATTNTYAAAIEIHQDPNTLAIMDVIPTAGTYDNWEMGLGSGDGANTWAWYNRTTSKRVFAMYGTGIVQTAGNILVGPGDTYYSIRSGTASAAQVVFGYSADKALYYDADNHVWRTATAGSNFMTLNSAGIEIFTGSFNITKGAAFTYGTTDNNGISFKTNNLIRWSVNTNGNLEGDTTNGGSIKMGPAASKIVAGATSISLRNNADNANNVLVEDAGVITFRNQLKFTAGAATSLGTTDDFGLSIKTNGLVRFSFDTTGGSGGNILADTTNGGYITVRAGTSSVTGKVISELFVSNNATTTSTTTATLTSGSNGGTYSLKANTMNANGDTVRIRFEGFISATTGTFTFTFGGSTIINALALSSSGTFALEISVTRRDSTHIDWTYKGLHFNAANVTDLNRGENVNVDLTTDLTLNFQGAATSGTLTGKLCQIILEPAP